MNARFGIALFATLLVAGCIHDPAGPGAVTPVDSALRVSMVETLPGRALLLDTRTSREYPCGNYVIETLLEKPRGGFAIEWSDVFLPGDICLTSIGPASSESNLGALARGSYALRVSTPEAGATLAIDVQDGSYGVLGDAGPVVKFDEIELRRIPNGTIWGIFGYATPATETKVEATLAAMAELGATPVRLATGRYSVRLPQYSDRFRIRPDGTLQREDAGYYFTRSFIFHYDGDRNELRDLVARVGSENGDALHLRLFTTQGDTFLSWYQP